MTNKKKTPEISKKDAGKHIETSKAHHGKTRRDFLYLATGVTAALGTAAAVWPFLKSLGPGADTLSLSTLEVDLSPIQEGKSVTVMWRGKPVFVRRRTQEEIEEARKTPMQDLKDPQTDESRTEKPEWLVVVGICTHLGCVPLGQKLTENRGDYGGWFCPCHGSHYDTSGRIRKGPAPKNLEVPEYGFISDTALLIGAKAKNGKSA